jgi:Active DUF488-N3 subclade
MLAPEYRERYLHEILDQVDLDPLVAELPADRASALFCVERDPDACHRSLVAERLAEEQGVPSCTCSRNLVRERRLPKVRVWESSEPWNGSSPAPPTRRTHGFVKPS